MCNDREQMMDAADREIDELEEQLANGDITDTEFQEYVNDIGREVRFGR